ncbi:hypothetical protein SDC9_132715 [bioreactor metagenome]|uniref:Uncharacterized protein n=1 Tax=bioreactor metagenome TaxID=1076179 RepID=A0A645D8G6_9ZZZZ
MLVDIVEPAGSHHQQHHSVFCHSVGVACGSENHLDLLQGSVIEVDVVQTCALFAHALQILAHIHHGRGHRLGAAHDDVGLIFLQLPDISLLIQSAGNLDFHIVVVENLGCDVTETVRVIGLEFHVLRSSINPFLSAAVPLRRILFPLSWHHHIVLFSVLQVFLQKFYNFS